MSLTWHIVRKDLRRMRVPLALWAVVLIAKGEIGVHLLHGDATDMWHFDLMKMGVNVLLGLDIFVNCVLVALLVQEDAVVGTRMFWATRPIAGGRLLVAKAIGALLMFAALPIIIALRWWLACGYGAGEIGRAVVVTLDGQLLVLFGAVLFATLTETVNRFFLAVLGAWVASMAWVFLLTRIDTNWNQPLPWVTTTRGVIFGALLVTGFVGAIVVQFRTRQLRRSVAIAAISMLAAGAVAIHGPWGGFWSRAGNPSAAGITIALERAEVESPSWRERQSLRLDFSIKGLSEDFGLQGSVASTWRWPDGTVASDHRGIEAIWTRRAERLALGFSREELIGGVQPSPLSDAQPPGELALELKERVSVRIGMSREQVERLRREPARFSARLNLALIRAVKVVELPLRPTVEERDGFSLRIASAQVREGELALRMIESRPFLTTLPDRRPGLSSLFGWWSESDGGRYFLVNRAGAGMRSVSPGGNELVVGTQGLRWIGLTIVAPPAGEAWALAVVRYRTEPFRRDVIASQVPVTLAPTLQ